MLNKRERRSSDKGIIGYMKWILTAISGALTTALIVTLGPVST